MRYEVNLGKPTTATADQLNESVKYEGMASPNTVDNKLRKSHIIITNKTTG